MGCVDFATLIKKCFSNRDFDLERDLDADLDRRCRLDRPEWRRRRRRLLLLDFDLDRVDFDFDLDFDRLLFTDSSLFPLVSTTSLSSFVSSSALLFPFDVGSISISSPFLCSSFSSSPSSRLRRWPFLCSSLLFEDLDDEDEDDSWLLDRDLDYKHI